jgi:hypothetical protein
MKALLATGLLLSLCLPAPAASQFSSGPARVNLVELYTSEGCSSCPPADTWLGKLKDSPILWRDVVPVAFHVNYWDHLGWKDRLSRQDFTAREYAYASAWGSANVYTPCFVRDGREWRPDWGTIGGEAAPMGRLILTVGDDGVCAVEFRPGPAARPAPDGTYEVHLALLGGGLSSKVTAGENSGETLRHEFVVLGLAGEVLSGGPGPAALRASLPLPTPLATGAKRHAVAAWVTGRGRTEVVQAVGGWLP